MNRKAAMEMSIGTVVTIVLLMSLMVLGIVLIQKIFYGATNSVDTVNQQVKNEINNLFNTQNKDIVINLGKTNTAKVKRGTDNFGFVFGYSPDDPSNLRSCRANIEAVTSGTYCATLGGYNKEKVENWVTSGTNQIQFDEVTGDVGYGLVTLSIPENTPICLQKYLLEVDCPGGESSRSYFQIDVIKSLF